MIPVRLALIGFGWFAELLVTRVFVDMDDIAILAVIDPSPDRRARAEELGLVAVTTISGLPPECEGVVVLTPHSTHRPIVEEAAAAGLHVFCEKAFAVTSEDCVAMIDACRRADVTLSVGHMQKLFPTHARAIELVKSEIYGRVIAVQVAGWHWCPVMPGWWRTIEHCGGLLYWTGVHDLDTIRAIVGSEVKSVYAVAGMRTDNYTEYEDSIAATLIYRNGVIGTIQVAEHDPIRTFEESFQISVLLESGSILINPADGTVTRGSRSGQERGKVVVENFGTFESLEESAYREEFGAFAREVRGLEVGSTAIDGMRAVETLEAIYRSVATGEVEAVQPNDPARLGVA